MPGDAESTAADVSCAPSGNDGWLDAAERQSNLTRSEYLIWTGQRIAPQRPLYNMIFTFQLRGPLNPEAFCEAWREVLESCDALRGVIEVSDGIPNRCERPLPATPLERVDLSGSGDPGAALTGWVEARKVRPFVLEENLVDAALIEMGPEHYVWYLNQHHLITDAWSCRRVVELIGQAYARKTEDASARARVESRFADYAAAERQARNNERAAASRTFWEAQLADPPRPTGCYGLTRNPGDGSNRRYSLSLTPARMAELRSRALAGPYRAMTADLSIANLLVTVLLGFMARTGGGGRLSVGLPLHNRANRNDRTTVGLFMEVYPLIVEVDTAAPLKALVSDIQRGILTMLSHSGAGQSTAATGRVCDVLLNYAPIRMPALPGVECQTQWERSGFGDPQHDLTVLAYDFDGTGGLRIDLEFSHAAFPTGYPALATGQFERLLDAVVNGYEGALDELDLLTEPQRSQQFELFQPGAPAAGAGNLVGAFLAAARETPSATAVSCGSETIDYRDLAERVAGVARRLRSEGVGPGAPVPVLMERGTDAVVALLGILRAGGAFVPLEPRHPHARIAGILGDLAAAGDAPRVLLTDQPAEAFEGWQTIDTRTDCSSGRTMEAGTLPEPRGDQPAYVIYTSGSTGRPKGTVVSHGSLFAYANWARHYYGVGIDSAFALHTSLSVDLTLTSIFVPLISGGRIVVYPDRDDGAPAVLDVYAQDAVDFLKLTPSHLALISETDCRSRRIRTLILGGEDLKTALLRSTRDRFADSAAIYNEYGPTEATVGCMIHRYQPGDDALVSVPIGRPVDHARIYLLDERLRPLPIGVPGEICIGGSGLALAYLGRQRLTEERFVRAPQICEGRLYRSGDRGRWTPTGRLEYLGRADDQLKLRGVRIETGEIEAALLASDDIAAAAVVVTPQTGAEEPLLVAVCQAHGSNDASDLRDHLGTLLPPEMMPTRIEFVEEMPLTPGGKIDRVALAEMKTKSAAVQTGPIGEVETALAGLWRELLGLQEIGREESFFDLGGASMKALQLHARIARRFGVRLPLESVFTTPTIAALAAAIESQILAEIDSLTDEQAAEQLQDGP